MSAPTPATLHVDRHCLIVLERVLLAAAPQEGCALLLGRNADSALLLERIWPCCNSWEPAIERQRRFLIDPREQLLAQRWARERDALVLGAAHSHPSSAAIPSARDLSLCCGPTLMLIRSGLHAADSTRQPQPDRDLIQPLRAWWLPEQAGWADDRGSGQGADQAVPRPQELEIALDRPPRTGHLGE